MLAGSYLTRTKAGSGNRITYILGYMLPGNLKGDDGEELIMVQGCALVDQLLQSTDQFFLFALLWTTQYTAHSTTPSAYKYSTCTRTPYPAHIVLTTCPTCLQPVPYQPPSSIRCHRLLRAPPRLCPATAASGKPTSPTSATLP